MQDYIRVAVMANGDLFLTGMNQSFWIQFRSEYARIDIVDGRTQHQKQVGTFDDLAREIWPHGTFINTQIGRMTLADLGSFLCSEIPGALLITTTGEVSA